MAADVEKELKANVIQAKEKEPGVYGKLNVLISVPAHIFKRLLTN